MATPIDDNIDYETGAVLDDDNVVFTYGDESNTLSESATLLREREVTDYNEVAYGDATAEQRAGGQTWWRRDTSTQEHQDLYDGMGNYVGEGDEPLMFGEGVGGEGTNTFVSVQRNIFQRAWCLVGDCSDVNTNTQRQLNMFDDSEEEPAYYSNTGVSCYDENEEYICDGEGNLITETSGGGGGFDLDLGDDEKSETMSNGTTEMVQTGVPKWILPVGILALGGSYYYGTNKQQIHSKIKSILN